MLHIAGVTPEADLIAADADRVTAGPDDLARVWQQLNLGPTAIELVAFGSPHFSHTECRKLADLFDGKQVAAGVTAIVTLGHDVLAAARDEGLTARLESAGVRILQDLCWCSISEPVFPTETRTVITNSGKYAHYGPGLSGCNVRLGSLSDCVTAALTGRAPEKQPPWIFQSQT